jgi:hypothetical protein
LVKEFVGIFYGRLVYFTGMYVIGNFYGHLVHFVAIWYILWPFGMFSPVLVCCTKKNLATLIQSICVETGPTSDEASPKNLCESNFFIPGRECTTQHESHFPCQPTGMLSGGFKNRSQMFFLCVLKFDVPTFRNLQQGLTRLCVL